MKLVKGGEKYWESRQAADKAIRTNGLEERERKMKLRIANLHDQIADGFLFLSLPFDFEVNVFECF